MIIGVKREKRSKRNVRETENYERAARCRAGSGRKRVFEEERINIVKEARIREERNINRRCGAHTSAFTYGTKVEGSERERKNEE